MQRGSKASLLLFGLSKELANPFRDEGRTGKSPYPFPYEMKLKMEFLLPNQLMDIKEQTDRGLRKRLAKESEKG